MTRRGVTVGQLLDEWLELGRSKRKPRTLQENRRKIDHRIRPLLGDLKLEKLDAARLDKTYRHWLDQGLSEATVHKYHCILSAACRQAVKPGSTDRRPGDTLNFMVTTSSGATGVSVAFFSSRSGRARPRVCDSHWLSVPSFSRLRCTGRGGLTTPGLVGGPAGDRVPVRTPPPTATRAERGVSVGHRGGPIDRGWTGTGCALFEPPPGGPPA